MSITLASDGTLSIVGSSANDIVEVTGFLNELGLTPTGTIRARLNATSQDFDYQAVKKVVVDTGDGNDTILKDLRRNGLNEQVAPSTINSGNHNDTITLRDNGTDVVNAGAGDDQIFNLPSTSAGDNFAIAIDTVNGGNGNDVLQVRSSVQNNVAFFGEGNNDSVKLLDLDSHVQFTGGSGVDSIEFSTSMPGNISVTLDNARNDGFGGNDNIRSDVENITVSADGDLTIVASDAANLIRAGASQNVFIDGRGGNDDIEGASSEANITIHGGAGDDKIRLISFSDDVRDTRQAFGDAGNDLLIGSAVADALFGGDGNDTMDGGLGGDLIDGGGWGADVVDYSKRTSPLYVNASDAKSNDGYGDEHDNVLANVEVIQGGSHNDTLIGNAANNVINGNGGNDRIFGGAGNDVITGGPGLNSLYGESGNDTIFAKWGTKDLVDGGPGIDSAQVDNGLDSIFNIENFI